MISKLYLQVSYIKFKWGVMFKLLNLFVILVIILFTVSCNMGTKANNTSIVMLADIFFVRVLETYPEVAYYEDIPIDKHDGITSNNLKDIKQWETFIDSIYSELIRIDEKKIAEKSDKITYWILRETLESNIEMRVCKRYLWDVNHLYGWQTNWTYIADFQPVGSENFREQAFNRWNKYPIYIDTEIENLKKGILEGYTMPRVIVNLVIDQLQVLLDYKIDDSPFMSPAKRDRAKDFYSQWEILITKKILPAILKYQNFLRSEYINVAREDVSILALPSGTKCYQAYIRNYTTTNKTGNEIFELGENIVQANKMKVIELGEELYQSNEFTEIIRLIKEDSSNYFKTSDEILDYNSQLLLKAKEESENWFAILPSTEITIKPYKQHEAGIGSYEQAKGEKPAYFRINLNNPSQQQKGDNEKLTFHEAYPGHHLQIGIEKDIDDIHPISKLTFFGSYSEGWARYSEQLAEEMGLYQNKSALIDRRAWPARGMVVDPGVHLNGWTKEQAVEYMMESGMNEDRATSVYHRSIVWPAQLTSYDVGGEEIKALRKLAEEKLRDDFDIKKFHTKILENGSIPLIPLRYIIEDWINKKTN